MTEEQIQALIDERNALESLVDTLTSEKLALANDIEIQGQRLTKAMDDILQANAKRDQLQRANSALQSAIHAATASVPEIKDLSAQVLDTIENSMINIIKSNISALKTQIRGGE